MEVKRLSDRREHLEKEIEKMKDLRDNLYEDMKDGVVTKKDYMELRQKFAERLSNITKYTFAATLNGALPEGKGNGRVNLSERKLNKYLPARMTAKERERIIIELLEKWKAEKELK